MVRVRLVAYNGDVRLVVLAIKTSLGKVRERGVDYYLSVYPEEKPDKVKEWVLKACKEFPSVLEHVTFTFIIENISRVTSHQLVRHRIASFTQESQRYSLCEGRYITPLRIKIHKFNEKYRELVDNAVGLYKEMASSGVPIEDARYVLPQCVDTMVMMTVNLRELLHILKLRLSSKAQWEIREVAKQMLEEVRKVIPFIDEMLGVFGDG